MENLVPSVLLLGLAIWAIPSIYLFASRNGTFRHFGSAMESGKLPDGIPLMSMTTNGRFPGVDWQVTAPAAFLWSFGNGLHPDVSLAGILFAGAWAPSWILIVLESLRNCNQGRIISFISIWGILQFQQSHALISPLYLAVHLLTSPSSVRPSTDDILVDPIDLMVLPLSFIFGFVVPLIPTVLPAPSVISIRLKHTAMGWYQQWNLWIALPQLILAMILRRTPVSSWAIDRESLIMLYDTVYSFAFAFAALSHLSVVTISCTAAIWPALFHKKYVRLLKPGHLLVPTYPFSHQKAKDLAQGVFWLIQWDYLGNFSHALWAMVMYSRAMSTIGVASAWYHVLKRAGLYFLLGGPAGTAVGLMWERDQLLLGL